MKVKQYIYHWLFFPLLVLLLAGGATSCSNDSSMEEEDNNTSHTYLTITTRGINVTDDSDFENYVGKLRVMAFDSQGKVVSGVNFTIDDLRGYMSGEGDDTYITVKQEILGGIMTSGTYSFYFVANETGYNTTNESKVLSEVLKTVKTEDELKNIKVKTEFTNSKPDATNMLMSVGPLKVLIREGENNEIGNVNNRIELIRAFAKAQLLLKVKSGVTEPASTKVSLSVPAPNSFYLLPGNEEKITSTTNLPPYIVAESGDNSLMDTELTASDYFFISEVVYLPERYLSANTEENAIKYQITLDKAYEVPIADNTTDNLDYSIKRNYAYTTIGTYAPETTVTLNWQVKPYDNVKVDVPTFE
ncbi:fimbrial protein [Phocaeicola barnesiae]|uniref:fimbrial protein n=1 Tax=Phocaeicola barnesiae TaxID=376804 RepID=UPI00241E6F54|nr:fimbrial protein [Phocaeicola barnesiae]